MTARRCALCPIVLLDDEDTHCEHCEHCAPFALDPWYTAPSSTDGGAVLHPPAERHLL